jgi:phospholipase C
MPADRSNARGKATSPSAGRPENSQDPAADPIRHVIVLMLENRSFDQMLGALQEVYPDLDGTKADGRPRSNRDADGQPIEQAPVAGARMKDDPKHELPNALHQLEDDNGNFVLDFAKAYPHSPKDERRQIMAYFPVDGLAALHALAREFTVCDRWFSSLPGSTWPNRLFVHSGTSLGQALMPQGPFDLARQHYDQDTLYDRLNERNVDWRIYFGDFPQSLLLEHQRRPENARRYRPMKEFFADAEGPEYKFPAYSFIEPRYYAPHQNDDHPPHDVYGAQRLIADVYNAIRKNDRLWESTLLVIVYDEHGGFYDHVPPPAAVPPDEHRQEYSFDRLGVRVPAVLVSPWVDRRVEHTVFDHTSILKYAIDKWSLGSLGERAASANPIGVALRGGGEPRRDTPERLHVPEPDAATMAEEAREPTELNELQMAMSALSMYLEVQTPGDPKQVVDRLKSMMENPASQARFAADAVRRFVGAAEKPVKPGAAGKRPKPLVAKGHPGKGGQGRAHRKKVTVKKVHHEKAVVASGRPKGKTRLRPA